MYRGILTLLVGLMLSLGESVEVNASKGDGSLVQGQPGSVSGHSQRNKCPTISFKCKAVIMGVPPIYSEPSAAQSQEAFLVELLRQGLSCYPVDEKKDEVEIGLKKEKRVPKINHENDKLDAEKTEQKTSRNVSEVVQLNSSEFQEQKVQKRELAPKETRNNINRQPNPNYQNHFR